MGQALAHGDPVQLLKLIRQLSDQLRSRPLPKEEFDARLEMLARQTSRSLPALKAWLEGEEFVRRGHWYEAIGAFHSAATFDPEFALVQYHLGVAAHLSEPGLADDALERALRNSDRLSASERILLRGRIAVQEGRLAEAESVFSEASRRYPDDTEAWLELGELLFHQNSMRARSSQESADALQHVLVLDPLNTEAMQHLVDLALIRGERTLASRLADRLLALVDDPSLVVFNRLVLAWAQNDDQEREKVIADLLKPGVARSLIDSGFSRAVWLGQFEDASKLATGVASSESQESGAWGSYLQGVVDLASGRPEAGRRELARAARLDPSSNAAWRVPWISSIDFFPIPRTQLAADRAAAGQIDVSRNHALLPQRTYLVGILAARDGDEAAAEKAAADLERMPALEGSSITTDLALAVRARVLAAHHEHAAALALLERQRLRIPSRFALTYRQLAESPLRAMFLAETGRTREALQAWDALDVYNGVDPVFVPAAQLAKAKIYDKADDRDAAISHYERFAELWKNCEPALRPEVEAAQRRIVQLRQAGQRASR
jgi:tetratricopeptide (TPR) repeat protein